MRGETAKIRKEQREENRIQDASSWSVMPQVSKHGLRFFIIRLVDKVAWWQFDKVAGGKDKVVARWHSGWCHDKVAGNRLEKHLQKDATAVL